MKNRQISLYSYIVFLAGMYGVWYQTIQAKKHGGYDLSTIPDLIDQLNHTQTLIFQVQDSFSSEEIKNLNSTLTNQYSKFSINLQVIREQQQGQLSIFTITILKGDQFSINIPTLKSINIVTQTLSNPSMIRNIKRYINKFYPLVNEETQMERRQLYTDRLLIFDFFFVNKQNQTSYPQLIQDVEQSIVKLAQHFELPKENIQINYKNIMTEAIINEENKIELTKQKITQFTEKHQQTHSMNWKEYFQLDILALLTDPEVNVVVDSEENVSFTYIEPTHFLFHINSKESLFKNIFQAFAVLLQIEDQLDIIFDGLEFHPSIQLLKQYFQEREFQRQIQHFIDELKYIQFLQSEGDYKITLESQQEFQKRVQYISDTLKYSKLRPSETANILIDDRFSNLDTFSFEYTLGMYLPLILPFAYPIILSIYDELSSK